MKTKNKVILKRQKTLKRRQVIATITIHRMAIAQLIVLFLIGVVIGRWIAIILLTQ